MINARVTPALRRTASKTEAVFFVIKWVMKMVAMEANNHALLAAWHPKIAH